MNLKKRFTIIFCGFTYKLLLYLFTAIICGVIVLLFKPFIFSILLFIIIVTFIFIYTCLNGKYTFDKYLPIKNLPMELEQRKYILYLLIRLIHYYPGDNDDIKIIKERVVNDTLNNNDRISINTYFDKYRFWRR